MSAKKKILKSYWIIINEKKGSIWKKPYLSLDEAKRELNDQLARNGYLNPGWEIQQRETFIEVDDTSGVSDEFSDF